MPITSLGPFLFTCFSTAHQAFTGNNHQRCDCFCDLDPMPSQNCILILFSCTQQLLKTGLQFVFDQRQVGQVEKILSWKRGVAVHILCTFFSPPLVPKRNKIEWENNFKIKHMKLVFFGCFVFRFLMQIDAPLIPSGSLKKVDTAWFQSNRACVQVRKFAYTSEKPNIAHCPHCQLFLPLC